MTRKNGLPRRVYLRHGAFYYVTPADGQWLRLSAEKDGLPAMYRSLAALSESEATSDCMPAIITRWADEKRPEWADSTADDQDRLSTVMAEAFADFRPAQVTTPVCKEYLRRFVATPRTYNMHRSMLRQVLAFAAREGLREGHNPVENIPQKTLKGRKRWVLDSEVAAIKEGAMKAARNGQALVQMIDLALLTGQRIGDLIRLRWQDVSDEGLRVQQGKTQEKLLIEWSPALRAAIKACERGDRIGHVLKTQSGRGYRYAGIRSAWVRACQRAGIEDLNIHDLRGRAGMDKRESSNLEGAKDLLGHRSVKTTEHYVDGKAPRRVTPAR
jgi:integrase